MPLNKKAQGILFDTYWSPRGWKTERNTDAVEFAYARSAGYMFDAIELTHDDIVERLLTVRRRISLREAADAFVASLSNSGSICALLWAVLPLPHTFPNTD